MTRKKIRLVVCDWNGMLLADTHACYLADCHVIHSFGGTPPALNEYRDKIIIPAINFYEQFGCNRKEMLERSQYLGEIFHTFYESKVTRCRTRKGARTILTLLKQVGIEGIILSNHTNSGIRIQLQRLKIEGFFREVLGNDAGETSMLRQAKGERLSAYLKKTGIQPEESVIIGDSPEEAEIGKRLGIMSILITGGYYATWRLQKANPDHIISNLLELKDIII